jgi:HSP20 family molecular chaperone IbpA
MDSGEYLPAASQRKKTMDTESLTTENDLNLTFDRTGRMWKFRPAASAHGSQPVDAHMTPEGIVLTVKIDGLESGDVDLCANGDVLEIRGRADRTMHLACDVGMPGPVALEAITTEYKNGVLFIAVPPIAADATDRTDAVPECIQVAV